MYCKLATLLLQITLTYSLTCDEILQFPAEKKLSLSELQSTPPKDMDQCLGHLGKERLPAPDAAYIWKSIIQFYDGIINIPDKVLMQLHWVTVAVTPEDYANITLSNIEVIENFGLNYNLDKNQLAAIANRVREDFAGKEPEDFTFFDLTALRQILCAFNKSDIARIHPLAYREAALIIGKLENCNEEVMLEFGKLAVQEQAFGTTANWNENTLKIVGKVADFLPKVFSNKLPRKHEPV